jgi:hypothetical protein
MEGESVMDKNTACHAIALEASKAFAAANMPEYVNNSGVKGLAKDMAQQYIDAYKSAESVFKDPKNIPRARMR